MQVVGQDVVVDFVRTILQGWALAVLATAPAAHAATSRTIDLLPDPAAPAARESVDVGTVRPLSPADRGMRTEPAPPSGNPLWSIPLSVLKATQERPIFSATRRPPPRAVAAPPVEAEAASAPTSGEPQRPPFAFVGAVVGDTDSIAIFVDQTDQSVVRVRAGESRGGWLVESVMRREVTLKRGEQVETLTMQRTDASQGAARDPLSAAQPGPAPAGNYAPFIPRATPKNGESDGL